MIRQLAIAIAATVALGSAAQAGEPAGYVTAQSDFGTQTVSGAVRMTRKGPQVQLPGGNWIYCAKSCSETLRLNTVDFWESEASGNRNATTHGPGLFGKLEFRW
jgi:hypothetical protein